MLTNNYPFQKILYRISMISNSEGHGSHGNKGTGFLGSVNVPMSVISKKLHFVEIS